MLEFLERTTLLREEDLMPDEKILMDMFQSWYIELKSFIMMGILLLFSFLFIVMAILTPNLKIGPISLSPLIFLGLAFFIIIAILIIAVSVILHHYSTRYYITSDRVLARRGLFTKNVEGVPYSKIQDIELRKSFYESIADIGDILIDVAGTSGVELSIDNVRDPEKPYRLILEKMRGKKDNSGV